MNAIGIDVSKGKSIVTILRHYGEMLSRLHKIRHTSNKINAFIKIAHYALDKWHELRQYETIDELRTQLKTMNRQFAYYMKHKTSMNNNLIILLDKSFPEENDFFDNPARNNGSQKWGDFIYTYWHIDRIRCMSLDRFIEDYQK